MCRSWRSSARRWPIELAGLEKEIHALAGREFKISSLKELQKVLFDELKLPVQKRTGIKNEPSTDRNRSNGSRHSATLCRRS